MLDPIMITLKLFKYLVIPKHCVSFMHKGRLIIAVCLTILLWYRRKVVCPVTTGKSGEKLRIFNSMVVMVVMMLMTMIARVPYPAGLHCFLIDVFRCHQSYHPVGIMSSRYSAVQDQSSIVEFVMSKVVIDAFNSGKAYARV